MEDSLTMVLSSLKKNRIKKMSRSSISDVPELFPSDGSRLAKGIIKNLSDGKEQLNDGDVSITFTNDHTYKGTIQNGLLQGHGRFTWSDGVIYEGEFKNGNISGKGTYTWKDGSWYIGEVLNGLRNGKGTFHHSNGECVYEGEWSNGMRHGRGKITYDSLCQSFYDGQWKNNEQCGAGIRKYRSGNVYEGEWKSCHRHGNGTMYWNDRREKYSGEWRNGVQHGKGEHVWFMDQTDNSQFPMCNRYVGEWIDGTRQGKGTFYYASGGQYTGTWLSNMKHGEGCFILPNGQAIEGLFKNDRFVNQVGVNTMERLGLKSQGMDVVTTRPQTPLGCLIGDIDGICTEGSTTQQFNLSIFTLISPTLEQTYELQQVHCVILRYLTQLKKTYHFYSSLKGEEREIGSNKNGLNTLNRIQLWRLLGDCELHSHNLTLTKLNDIIEKARGNNSSTDLYTTFLMREFLQCIVYIAHEVYEKNSQRFSSGQLGWCLDQFMKKDFIPNACRVKGLAYKSPQHIAIVQPYIKSCYNIYQKCTNQTNRSLTQREFMLLLKDCEMFDNHLIAEQVVKILVSIQPLSQDENDYNLQLPIVFLEFLDALLSCSLLWYQESVERHSDEREKVEENVKMKMPSRVTFDEATVNIGMDEEEVEKDKEEIEEEKEEIEKDKEEIEEEKEEIQKEELEKDKEEVEEETTVIEKDNDGEKWRNDEEKMKDAIEDSSFKDQELQLHILEKALELFLTEGLLTRAQNVLK